MAKIMVDVVGAACTCGGVGCPGRAAYEDALCQTADRFVVALNCSGIDGESAVSILLLAAVGVHRAILPEKEREEALVLLLQGILRDFETDPNSSSGTLQRVGPGAVRGPGIRGNVPSA